MIKSKLTEEEAMKNFQKLYYQIKNKILYIMQDKNITTEVFVEKQGMSLSFFEEIMTTEYQDFSLYLEMLNTVEMM